MKNISFGTIKKFFFIGGGQSLFEAARHLKISTENIFVFTSERHYGSKVNFHGQEIQFFEALKLIGVNCTLLQKFDSNSHYFDEFDSASIMITPSSEWIFRQSDIDRFGGRVVNIHGSFLPEMKGGGGVSWNAMMGSKHGGVTIHMVDVGIDTGDILFQKKYNFPDNIFSLEDYTNLAELENAKAITSFLDGVMKGVMFERISQDLNGGSYWPRLKTEIHGYINWSWSAEEIHRFIVAFGSPYSGAMTFMSGQQFNIMKSSILIDGVDYHPFQYGIIYRVAHDDIFVAAKGGSLVIHNINRSNGEEIDIKKFLGNRFVTPEEKLNQAMRDRVIFNPSKIRALS
jgi:methionyl-tRNA formyltransferase